MSSSDNNEQGAAALGAEKLSDAEYQEALGKLRQAIDGTDAELLELLNRRAGYARDVGHLKTSRGQAPSRMCSARTPASMVAPLRVAS